MRGVLWCRRDFREEEEEEELAISQSLPKAAVEREGKKTFFFSISLFSPSLFLKSDVGRALIKKPEFPSPFSCCWRLWGINLAETKGGKRKHTQLLLLSLSPRENFLRCCFTASFPPFLSPPVRSRHSHNHSAHTKSKKEEEEFNLGLVVLTG